MCKKWRVQEWYLGGSKVPQVGRKAKSLSLLALLEAKRSTDNHGDCLLLGPVVKSDEWRKKIGREATKE